MFTKSSWLLLTRYATRLKRCNRVSGIHVVSIISDRCLTKLSVVQVLEDCRSLQLLEDCLALDTWHFQHRRTTLPLHLVRSFDIIPLSDCALEVPISVACVILQLFVLRSKIQFAWSSWSEILSSGFLDQWKVRLRVAVTFWYSYK